MPPLPSPDDNDLCGICNKTVTHNEKPICCDKCKKWIHTKCNKITNKQYIHYNENPNDTFECKNCNRCGVCERTVAKNHHAIECDLCSKWVHIKCNKLSMKDYSIYQNDETTQFYCIKCLRETLPALGLDDAEFNLTMNGIDFPDEINVNEIYLSDSQKEIINKINEAIINGINGSNEEIDDENDIPPIDCKYYTTNQFNAQNFESQKHFSILHLNIHSAEFHIEEFRIALQLINLKFDFICLTESKIRKNREPNTDITINGYKHPIGMPTEATKGGVLIYVKEGINYRPREDLNMHRSKELESYFVEAINDKGKNSIIGVIYRHPCMDQNIFIDDYMKPLNDKLLKENKKSYLLGDFNFDFLNASNNETFNFFETMMSSFQLPVITIPTKINTHKHTVIDNIFTNNTHPDMKSGNLTLAISDHLPSFYVVPRDNQNHMPKKQNLYTRKTKQFYKVNFILDYFDIDWNNILELNQNDVNVSLNIFLTKMNELFDKYMPLRKMTQKEYKRRFKPWITDNILEKIYLKNKIFRKYMKCKDGQPILKEQLEREFKSIKNEVTLLTRQSKKKLLQPIFY